MAHENGTKVIHSTSSLAMVSIDVQLDLIVIIIYRGSTGSDGKLTLNHFLECGINQCCLTPTFSCINRWFTFCGDSQWKLWYIFLRENAPNFGVFRFAWLYAKTRDSGLIFAFDSVLISYSLTFGGSRLQFLFLTTLPLSSFPCTADARDVTHWEWAIRPPWTPMGELIALPKPHSWI